MQETNEALALLAKAGDRQAAAQLWQQNQRLLALLLGRLYRTWRDRAAAAGVTWDDVQQLGYFAILRAVAAYDPARGSFATLLGHAARSVFRDLVRRHDPLDTADRLEDPLPGADGDGAPTLRGDLAADPAATQALEDADARLYNAQLHADLARALAQLPPQQAALLCACYYDGQTLTATAAAQEIPYRQARAQQQKALQQLARALRRWREETIAAKATCHTGFAAWKEGGSVEEWLVERLERHGL